MVAVERVAVEPVGDEHISGQRVLEQHERRIAVETPEGDVGDRRVGSRRRLDDLAVEGVERDALPTQLRCRPAGHAVKVGG